MAEPGHFPGAKGLPLRQLYFSGQRHVPNISSNWDACRKTQVKFEIVYFRTSLLNNDVTRSYRFSRRLRYHACEALLSECHEPEKDKFLRVLIRTSKIVSSHLLAVPVKVKNIPNHCPQTIVREPLCGGILKRLFQYPSWKPIPEGVSRCSQLLSLNMDK